MKFYTNFALIGVNTVLPQQVFVSSPQPPYLLANQPTSAYAASLFHVYQPQDYDTPHHHQTNQTAHQYVLYESVNSPLRSPRLTQDVLLALKQVLIKSQFKVATA